MVKYRITKTLFAQTSHTLKRVSLELGGKSPIIVLVDADLDAAVEAAHQAAFFNAGQVCCAGTRTFVAAAIYDEFVERSARRARDRRVGDPWSPDTEQGPQVDGAQLAKVLGLVQSGREEGARLVAGGRRVPERDGFFMEPTVFADVQDGMRIAREEIFGPVQQLLRFTDVDEAIERANASPYGLAAAVFTRDEQMATYVAHRVQAGTVWTNCYFALAAQAPFGGYKQSGWGRENGAEGMGLYTEEKTVMVRLAGGKNS